MERISAVSEQPSWRNLASVYTVTVYCENRRQIALLISLPVYCVKETEMRLDGYNPIGTETSGLDMDNLDISSSNSASPFSGSEKSVPSLNLTSELSLAQQKGQAAVDLYRIWYIPLP